jgi:outer membrane protein TolC
MKLSGACNFFRSRASDALALAVALSLASAALAPPANSAMRRPAGEEVLTLEQALRKANARGYTLEGARIQLRTAEILYRNAWDTMFLPQVSLALASTQKLTFGNIPGARADEVQDTAHNYGFPAGSSTTGAPAATLTLGSYTLFNFGKDLLAYERERVAWSRAQEIFSESARSVRVQVTSAFYNAKNLQDKFDAAQRSVEVAQAISDLLASRVKIGKATKEDFSSSQIDLSNAKNERETFDTQRKTAFWGLNQLMGEPIQTAYRITDSSRDRYRPLKLQAEQILKIYQENSPSVKTGLADIKRSEIGVKLAEKERLPLPKVTFSGVKVNYNQAYYGSKPVADNGSAGSVNMDVQAVVGVTIPIVGPGGLFNSRVVESAELQLQNSENLYRMSLANDQASILQAIQAIRQYEEQITNLKKSLESASSLLDTLFQQVSNQVSSKRLELRDALKQARDAEIAYNEAVFQHLTQKLTLAATIGVDRLPGDGAAGPGPVGEKE